MSLNLSRLRDPFPEKDIEWRVQRSGLKDGKPWALVLAYVDARAVQERLDDVCGPDGWRDEYVHSKEAGGFMCRLSILVWRNSGSDSAQGPTPEWVTKENGAPETDIEAMKGGISKAFVRAASTWGIGRYLYNLEAGFATFVEKKGPGVKSDKIEGKYYHWIPPKLPEWALPVSEKKQLATHLPPQSSRATAFAQEIRAAKASSPPKISTTNPLPPSPKIKPQEDVGDIPF